MNSRSQPRMKIKRTVPCATACQRVLLAAVIGCMCAEAGNAMPFTATQRETLARLVQFDLAAAKLFRKIQRLADTSLGDAPHPAKRIASAGRLASDPAKVESRLALEDMKKIEAFGFASVAS